MLQLLVLFAPAVCLPMVLMLARVEQHLPGSPPDEATTPVTGAG